MTKHVLIDTNVLVTAVDPNERDKSRTASLVLEFLAVRQLGAISTQVVAEFYATTTRAKAGRPPIYKPVQAVESIQRLGQAYFCLDITLAIVLDAVEAARRYQLNVYDAQLWSAAHAWDISYILTEDMQSRPWIDRVRFVNPFVAAFRLSSIGL